VLSLAARIRHHPRDFDGPPADAPGIVEITLRDGSVVRGEVKRSRGTPENPLSEDEIVAKFVANCGGDDVGLAQRILDLENERDMHALLRETAR
jgi:2-methylcitrate dehydratase PrpD